MSESETNERSEIDELYNPTFIGTTNYEIKNFLNLYYNSYINLLNDLESLKIQEENLEYEFNRISKKLNNLCLEECFLKSDDYPDEERLNKIDEEIKDCETTMDEITNKLNSSQTETNKLNLKRNNLDLWQLDKSLNSYITTYPKDLLAIELKNILGPARTNRSLIDIKNSHYYGNSKIIKIFDGIKEGKLSKYGIGNNGRQK